MARLFKSHGWTPLHLVLALCLVGLGIAVTFGAWSDIWRIATVDEEASHIFLVIPVAAWLVWVRRSRFRTCTPRGTVIGPILVLLGWAISAWGFRHSVQSLF